MILTKAIIITPTIGNNISELIQNIESVKSQTVSTHHLLVIDGPEHYDKLDTLLKNEYSDVNYTVIPFNTGSKGYYGHRVMAAFAHLHDFEYTLFLDEDNWIDENHVESLIDTIEKNDYRFSYSLRKIFRKNGEYACLDNCESLGLRSSITGYHLVDTSSYCFKTNFFSKVSHLWHKGWGADRDFFRTMMNMKSIEGKFDSSNLHTLNYRLGGNPNSVKEDFFKEGNKIMEDWKLC